MSKSILLLLLLFLSFSALSQSPCLEKFDANGIYLRQQIWGVRWVKDGVAHPLGLDYRRLAPEFEHTPQARLEFRKAQNLSKIGRIVAYAGLCGFIAGSFLGQHRNQGSSERHEMNPARIAGYGIGIVSLAVAMPIAIKSSRKLADAIWQRNREWMQ